MKFFHSAFILIWAATVAGVSVLPADIWAATFSECSHFFVRNSATTPFGALDAELAQLGFNWQVKQWKKLDSPHTISGPFGKIHVDYKIGGGNSKVYFSSKSRKIVKTYAPENEYLAKYEIRATEFLLSQGEDVPRIEFSQKTRNLLFRVKRIVLVKEFFEGFNHPYIDAYQDDLQKEVTRIRDGYFKSGKFRSWLKENDPKLFDEISRKLPHLLDEGDVRAFNMQYTRDGWKLIDP